MLLKGEINSAKEYNAAPAQGWRGGEVSGGREQNARPQQNFGGKELDQTPSASAPAAKKKKKRTAERLRRLMVGVAGAAVVTVAVVLPANVPKAQTDIRYTDTAIYYTIEVPQTDMQVTLVAENDFTRREQPLVPGSNEGVIEGLKPGMQYTVKVEGKLGPITLSLSEETVRTQTEAPKTQLFGVTHECTCNVDGLFHFTVDYIDEAGRWSDFEASLTDARGNRSSCAFTQDAHAPQSIDVIGAGLVGNSAAFVITCLDAESGGRTVLYEAQVKI